MSIWVSGEHIGTETWEGYEVEPGMVSIDLGDGKARAQAEEDGSPRVHHRAQRGQVRAYRDGFSNHYPDDTDAPGSIDLAWIPSWCVPGHDEEDYSACGEWARLSIDCDGAMTWWVKEGDEPTPKPVHASVVLDVEAARSLAADLLEWADRPHLAAVREGAS